MKDHTSDKIREELRHGHSGLILLLDEVDAHLAGLIDADSACCQVIIDDLDVYAGRFCDELTDHINEEEGDLFPLVAKFIGKSAVTSLTRLRGQHDELLSNVAHFLGVLQSVTDSECADADNVRLLQRLSAEMRSHLVEHSREEKTFLRELEARLPAAQ